MDFFNVAKIKKPMYTYLMLAPLDIFQSFHQNWSYCVMARENIIYHKTLQVDFTKAEQVAPVQDNYNIRL